VCFCRRVWDLPLQYTGAAQKDWPWVIGTCFRENQESFAAYLA
jgi:hypothetical protein